MVRWTGLAPCEFEFVFPGSLASTLLVKPLELPSLSGEPFAFFAKTFSVNSLEESFPRLPLPGKILPGSEFKPEASSNALS